MKELTINKEKVVEVYQNASAETKEALKALFGHESNFISKPKPTLGDYTTIRSYEDACEALEISPILSEDNDKALCAAFPNHYDYRQDMPSHIIALMKLETISRALWGKVWKPKPDAEGSKLFYYPVFALYTQQEIENMDEDKRRGLLSAYENHSALVGLGCLNAGSRSSYVSANFGFRLCQETEEKAKYFGRRFIELWAEYLKFGFEVGGKL